jgi:hypothetical protein
MSAGTSTSLDSPLICKFVMEIPLLPFPDTPAQRQATAVVPLAFLDSAQDLLLSSVIQLLL